MSDLLAHTEEDLTLDEFLEDLTGQQVVCHLCPAGSEVHGQLQGYDDEAVFLKVMSGATSSPTIVAVLWGAIGYIAPESSPGHV